MYTPQRDYLAIPLRDSVSIPSTSLSVVIVRKKFADHVSHLSVGDTVVLVTQKNKDIDNPQQDDLFDVGTVAEISNIKNLISGSKQILFKGLHRFHIQDFTIDDQIYVHGHLLETEKDNPVSINAHKEITLKQARKWARLGHKNGDNTVLKSTFHSLKKIDCPETMLDILIARIDMPVKVKQTILSASCLEQRFLTACEFFQEKIAFIQAKERIESRLAELMSKKQKEYVDQLKSEALKAESGGNDEYNEIEQRIRAAKMPESVEKKALGELKKMANVNPSSSEASVIRSYLEWMCDLPWSVTKTMDIDLNNARDVLDKEHHGLTKIKEEIIQHIAVYNRTQKPSGTVVCLVGPPGVGKTSLGQSIATATNRDFARIALGGMRDEAEIRGHRRTYVGAMPGRLLQELKRCGSNNPVFVLDEIDKVGQDWRGDPSSALLEVLDPEQNHSFVDHYLEAPFSLNQCMFICTANSAQNIPPALRDRMDIIHIPSYTEEEKIDIAQCHLLPKKKEITGLVDDELTISQSAIQTLIRHYTREAGVRHLGRLLAGLARKTVQLIDSKKENRVSIESSNLATYAGPPVFPNEDKQKKDDIGIATGLAWTEVGGDTLVIETVLVPGKGKVIPTGNLGDVMKESVHIAFSFLRAHASRHAIDLSILDTHDIHVHVPQGAVPKDGPSAGVALFLSMASTLLKKPLARSVSMTGEISLTGRVLPVGGIKEKIMAAHRENIPTVLIPKDNMHNLDDIPESVQHKVSIIPITHVDQALNAAMKDQPSQSSAA